MKTQRMLGLLWMVFCSYACLQGLWVLTSYHHYHIPLASVGGYYIGIVSLVYLVGAVASYLLLRGGTSWARIYVGCIAAFLATMVTFGFFKSRVVSMWDFVLVIFAVVSIALLFLPRREPDA
jgi:hypothetical protein